MHIAIDIAIVPTTLSDNSVVFDVRLTDGGEVMFFHAITEADARAFAAKLNELVNEHTTSLCSVT